MPEIIRSEWDRLTEEEKYRRYCDLVMKSDTLEGAIKLTTNITVSDNAELLSIVLERMIFKALKKVIA